MPRKADEFEVLEKPKRAPRKRAAKPVDDFEETKPKRTRRVAAKVAEESESVRRAPTPIAESKQQKKFLRKHTIVIAVLLFLGIGSSAAIGLTDKGQIDIVTIIDERNKKAAERGEQPISAEEELLPDGGLIPADPSAAPPPPPAVATSTASTTPEGNIPLTNEEAAAAMTENSATST